MAAGKVVVFADGKLAKTGDNEDATIDGNLIISGNLSVTGTSTTVNVEDLNVEQGEITLNYAAGDSSASANGAGIRIQDAVDASTDATILWDGTNDEFDFSHAINVTGNISVSGTVDGRDLATDGSKLDGIEAGADVTDATNVAAAGAVMTTDSDASSFSFVIDEDNLSSDSDTQVPTQGSVKAYVDAQVSGAALSGGTNITVSSSNINLDNDINFSNGTAVGLAVVGTKAVVQTFDLSETIAIGSVVCFSGNATVQKSDNTNSSKDMAIGVVVDDGSSNDYTVASDSFSNGGNGIQVAVAGSIVDSLVWDSGKEPTAVGQEIYMSAAGKATKDAPTSGAIYRIGYASHVDSVSSPAVYKVLLQPGFIMDN